MSQTLRTGDGETLALREWPAAGEPRAVVQLVHGIGEHIGRYAQVAQRLNGWGFAVRGHDHYGHGASSGARGGLPSVLRLVDDLALVLDDTRRAYPGRALVLLGDSLGGLVAASLVARAVRPVDALVLASPGLDPGLTVFQKLLVAVLPRIAPNLRVANGLDDNYLSHDRAVVQAAAPHWRVPTLLLYAGDDHLVNPAASRAFAAAAPAGVVEPHCFETLYHEIFNELDAGAVFDVLERWLGRALLMA